MGFQLSHLAANSKKEWDLYLGIFALLLTKDELASKTEERFNKKQMEINKICIVESTLIFIHICLNDLKTSFHTYSKKKKKIHQNNKCLLSLHLYDLTPNEISELSSLMIRKRMFITCILDFSKRFGTFVGIC